MDRRTAVLALVVALIVLAAPVAAQDEGRHYVYLPSVRFEPTPTLVPGPDACPNWLFDSSLEEAGGYEKQTSQHIYVKPFPRDWSAVILSRYWFIASEGFFLPLSNEPGVARTGEWGLHYKGTYAQINSFVVPRVILRREEDDAVRRAYFTFWYRFDGKGIAGGPIGPDIIVRAHGFNAPIATEYRGWGSVGERLASNERLAINTRNARVGEWRRAVFDIKQFIESYHDWELIAPSIEVSWEPNEPVEWYVDDIAVHMCLMNGAQPDPTPPSPAAQALSTR